MGLAAFNQMRRRLAEEAEREALPQPATAAEGGDPVSTGPSATADTPPPAWPLKQPPAEYLERYPEGKHAALARKVVGG